VGFPCVSHGGVTSAPVLAVLVVAAGDVAAAIAVAAVDVAAAAAVDHAHRWPSQGGDL